MKKSIIYNANDLSVMKKFLIFIVAPLIFFIFLSAFITYPLPFHLGEIATGTGDELLIAWIQNWVVHSITSNPFSIFNANVFYPYHNTLAYSDLFLTSSFLSLIPLKLIGQPIAVFNFTFISSLVLLGFSVYLLSYYLTRNFMASFTGGVLVIFSPAVLDKKVHLQILAIEWVPLSILAFLHFIKTNKTKFLMISLFFFLLQTYNSFMPGYFIVFFILIYFLNMFFFNRSKFKKILAKRRILLFVISLLLLLPAVIPYYKVSSEFKSVRDIKDSIHFALQPEDFIYPNEHTRLQTPLLKINSFEHVSQNAEIKSGYLGFMFTIMVIGTTIWFVKKFKRKNIVINSLFYTALLGLLLSLGPFLHLGRVTIHRPFPIPLPYLIFYYILPGFEGFRNSARFEMLFILCISVIIALCLSNLTEKLNVRTKTLLFVLIIFGVIAEYNFPMKFVKVEKVEQFPKVYTWVKTTPKDASFIFIPIYSWHSPYAYLEIKREYYSTVSFHKMVNGYSGFTPPPWQKFVEVIDEQFPKQNAIDLIKQKKVNYIIVEKNKLLNRNEVITKLVNNSSLIFVKQVDEDYIFRIN